MNNLFKHSVIKNIVALGVLQIANYIVPLLAWPLLAKSLGIEQFGLLMVLFAICTICYILTDFGFNLSATYVIAQSLENRQKIGELLGNIFTLKLLLATVACVFSSCYIYFYLMSSENETAINLWTIIFFNLIVFVQSVHCIWFFQGIEKMKYITKANVLAKVSYVLLLFIFLPYYTNINLALFLFFISQIMVSYLFLRSIYNENYYILKPSIKLLWNEFKYSFSFFLSRVAVSIYTTANVLILGHTVGNAIAGLYASAEKIYVAGNNVSSIIAQALYPYMARKNKINLLFRIMFSLMIPVILGTYVLSLYSDEMVVLLFGEAFLYAGELLKIFLILLCVTFFSVGIGYPGFAAVKKISWANRTVMIGAVFHLIGLLILFWLDIVNEKSVLYMVLATESIILVLRFCLLYYFSHNIKYDLVED
ncbi:oligosaccharide flippase family protein [Lonepinella sp. BR2882]|uniref:oligosaccharide flippase family protein n=1 Tax=Lonepinella sp. BR2882 TaxID=3095283 RepID=UPI003F6DC21A